LASIVGQGVGLAAHAQNHEMLNELQERERELAQLNQELKETNRGVLVLYSELEDRALELQQASEMKTRFFSSVTDELRTPLNLIVSLAGLLILRIDGELTAEQESKFSSSSVQRRISQRSSMMLVSLDDRPTPFGGRICGLTENRVRLCE